MAETKKLKEENLRLNQLNEDLFSQNDRLAGSLRVLMQTYNTIKELYDKVCKNYEESQEKIASLRRELYEMSEILERLQKEKTNG